MIEGELSEHGLAALGGDGQDVTLALARRLTERVESDDVSLEALFARTVEGEGDANGILVDGDWDATEPPTMERDDGSDEQSSLVRCVMLR